MARKKARPRRWRPDRPLELTGTVPRPRERPNPKAPLGRPIAALVRLVPTYRHTRAGERKRVAVKLALGAVAVGFAGLSREEGLWAIPSLVAVLLAVLLPVRARVHREWLRSARGLAGPRLVLEDAPAEVYFDGRKMTLGADGREWSVRPANAEVVFGVDDGPWLALDPMGKKTAGVAFRPSEGDEPHPEADAAKCPVPPERILTVDAEAWELILATFAPERSRTRSAGAGGRSHGISGGG